MKKAVFCTAAILALCIFSFGQKQKTPEKTVMLESGTRLEGKLQSTVDVKKARVGDQVVLKTTKDVKQHGRVVVAKGSQLIGRVTEVQQRTKQNGASRLGLLFDRVQGRSLSAPISASIVNITSAATRASLADDSMNADVFGSSATSTRTSAPARTSGGGLLGGVTQTVGGVVNTTTSTVGGVTNTVGSTVGSTAGSVVNTASGIQISNSTSASAQSGSTLTAAGRNIRLEKGATVQLQLNAAAHSE